MLLTYEQNFYHEDFFEEIQAICYLKQVFISDFFF